MARTQKASAISLRATGHEGSGLAHHRPFMTHSLPLTPMTFRCTWTRSEISPFSAPLPVAGQLTSPYFQAPLTVQAHAPLELVQQLFVKLGARYVIVTNSDGYCKFIWLRTLLEFSLIRSKTKGLLTRRPGWPFLANWNDNEITTF